MSYYLKRFDELNIIKEQKKESDFVVTFCGVFSSGKSSLINCLLDYKSFSLPVGINPLTKLVTRIEYGENLCFYYKRGTKKIILSKSEFEDMVTGNVSIPQYCSQIYIEIPSKILKSGIVFLDTPGFEDEAGGELEKISRDAIVQGDFVVVCTNALQFGDMFERELIDELEESVKNFILVINRIDCLNTEKEFESVKKRATKVMSDKGTQLCREIFGENIYYTVASGKIKNISELSLAMERLLGNYELKRNIKNDTFENIKRFKYKTLAEQIEIDLYEVSDERESVLEKHSQIIQEITQATIDENIEIEQKKKTKAINCEILLNDMLDNVRKYINQLETANKYASFVDDTKVYLISEIESLAKKISRYIYGNDNYKNLLNKFMRVINQLTIPEPSGQRVQTRGVLDRAVNTFICLRAGIFDIDDGCDMVYKNYASKAIQVVDSSLKPKLLNEINKVIDEVHGKAKDIALIQSGYEAALDELEKEIENLGNLKDEIYLLIS